MVLHWMVQKILEMNCRDEFEMVYNNYICITPKYKFFGFFLISSPISAYPGNFLNMSSRLRVFFTAFSCVFFHVSYLSNVTPR